MILSEIRELCSHISFEIFSKKLSIIVKEDSKYGGRCYIQVYYQAACNKTNQVREWKGGKHYLSEHMIEDEIVKKVYVAIEAAVKHEVMEGFKFDGIVVFNPHVDFRKLLEVSNCEVTRS